MARLALLLGILFALGGCKRPAASPGEHTPDAAPPYTFTSPAAAFALPSPLDEVSGLTVLGAGYLGAVEDETGTLYVLDIETAEVVGTRRFGPGGDYEGIEQVGTQTYVLRSDSRLFVFADWRDGTEEAEVLGTGLHGRCDAEGLALQHERLLIACKESAGRGRPGIRAVFGFDFERNALLPEPAYTIHADSLGGAERTLDERVRELVRPLVDINEFKPSALAVHPPTGHIYVISSVRKLIAVLEPDGTLIAAWPLPERLFRQPEGLAFLPDGTLFIANEGAGGDPTLLRFTYHPTP